MISQRPIDIQQLFNERPLADLEVVQAWFALLTLLTGLKNVF